MKLLLFSDVHCNEDVCRALVRRAAEADVVVAAGDIATMRAGLKPAIALLAAIDKPAILVPGNSESADELAEACRGWPGARVLHGSGTEVGGIAFYGVGGGIPVTPFGSWSYDFSEDEAAQLLAGCPTGGVLVTHSPPKGVCDLATSGAHYGSRAVRRAIEERAPVLAVCGHIHEAAGKPETLGVTTVINAGPGGVYWEI